MPVCVGEIVDVMTVVVEGVVEDAVIVEVDWLDDEVVIRLDVVEVEVILEKIEDRLVEVMVEDCEVIVVVLDSTPISEEPAMGQICRRNCVLDATHLCYSWPL